MPRYVILLEVAFRKWEHCGHKGMDMVSNNTQLGCCVLNDAQLVQNVIRKDPLHQEPELLI